MQLLDGCAEFLMSGSSVTDSRGWREMFESVLHDSLIGCGKSYPALYQSISPSVDGLTVKMNILWC